MALTVYRIQDADGRGPYKPGFSHRWTDLLHDLRNPPIMQDFPALDVRAAWKPQDVAMGCAFRTMEQLHQWFSADELKRLAALGYRIVQVEADRIVAESPRQLVFVSSRKLAECAIAE